MYTQPMLPLAPQVSDLHNVLQTIKAFYMYKQEGLKKALRLFPNSKLFIEENAKRSFDEVKHDLIEGIMKMQVVAA